MLVLLPAASCLWHRSWTSVVSRSCLSKHSFHMTVSTIWTLIFLPFLFFFILVILPDMLFHLFLRTASIAIPFIIFRFRLRFLILILLLLPSFFVLFLFVFLFFIPTVLRECHPLLPPHCRPDCPSLL
ncbi:hypothetical protein XPA_001698 [Xanthoria parietina]